MALVLVFALVSSGCLLVPEPGAPDVAFVGLVSSSHPDATAAGVAVLADGGNAVDAAAAVQFALNVVEPMMSGIGGGAFLLIWNQSSGRLTALDGREVAPAAATADMFQREGVDDGVDPEERGVAVGVPGTLKVWDRALRDHGTRTLADVLPYGVALARDGFEVDEITQTYIQETRDKLARWPSAAEVFLVDVVCPPQEASQVHAGETLVIVPCDGGRAPDLGTVIVQPRLAAALELIAQDGIDAFYRGPLGEALVAAQATRGGRMTMQDLAAYDVVERAPLLSTWRGLQVATLGLPSGGPVLHEALLILEPLDVGPRTDPDVAHVAIEAMHLAFADRGAYYGDPATALARPEDVLAPERIDTLRARIDMDRTGAPYAPTPVIGTEPPAQRDQVAPGLHTTHFTVIDRAGNIVAATSTIESIFGSGIRVPEWGFFLNNEMTDFDLEPSGPNEVGPGKRPLSSMTPTIVFDEDGPLMALGSPGGYTIPGTVLQVMLDVLGDGTALDDAVAHERWATGRSATLLIERGLPDDLVSDLRQRGHELEQTDRIGGVQAIHRTAEGWVASADHRRAGLVGSV